MFSPNSLNLYPSYRVSALLWIPHLAAIGLVWGSSAPQWLIATATVTIIALGIYTDLLHGWLRLRHSPSRLQVDINKPLQCRLGLKSGQQLVGQILPDSVVTARFVLLRIRPRDSRGSRTLVITRWNSDPDRFRRLRVILRFQPGPATDKALQAE